MMTYSEACDRGYDGPTYMDGGPEPEETGIVSTSKVVIARKARLDLYGNAIRPGDRVKVVNGFEYQVGGPRTNYFRYYLRLSTGPNWTAEETAPKPIEIADVPF